jgi:hypothetical protein
LHAFVPNPEESVSRSTGQTFLSYKMGRAVGDAGRRLLQLIESFPVPIEEALWVEIYRAGRTDLELSGRVGTPDRWRKS